MKNINISKDNKEAKIENYFLTIDNCNKDYIIKTLELIEEKCGNINIEDILKFNIKFLIEKERLDVLFSSVSRLLFQKFPLERYEIYYDLLTNSFKTIQFTGSDYNTKAINSNTLSNILFNQNISKVNSSNKTYEYFLNIAIENLSNIEATAIEVFEDKIYKAGNEAKYIKKNTIFKVVSKQWDYNSYKIKILILGTDKIISFNGNELYCKEYN